MTILHEKKSGLYEWSQLIVRKHRIAEGQMVWVVVECRNPHANVRELRDTNCIGAVQHSALSARQ
jgi:hypothetical protein